MGITHVTTRVEGLARAGEPYEGEFLVDTGSLDCMAPAEALIKAGIQEEGRDVYELASGDVVEYPYGFARVTFMGAETVTKIVFGPAAVEPILGVVALESVGIGVDPVKQTLRRMTAKPLKSVRTAKDRTQHAKGARVGLTYADVDIENPFVERRIEIRAMVDSGSLFFTVPSHVAIQLGFDPEEMPRRAVTLADGTHRNVPIVGPVRVHFAGRYCDLSALVLGNEPLMGAVAMEMMDLVLNPATQTLTVNPANPFVAMAPAKVAA